MRRILNFDNLFFLFAGYLLVKGLLHRDDSLFTAEKGVGYMLGIIGGSMMLALLLYPVRKHIRLFRSLGPVRYWFRLHMILGVAGPVLILYHANFSFGATNSNVALLCMLVVAGSGLFGRFFYSRIHQGLYGRKIEFGDLRKSLAEIHAHIETVSAETGNLMRELEQQAMQPKTLLLAAPRMLRFRVQVFRARQRTASILKSRQPFSGELELYFDQLIRLANYSVYERLFSLWHVFHIPLFILLVISGIVHVVAVHIY
ncbi:MAG: hypothetical protein QG652_183 [Pseudomonadota bacterium]|nr:hypothetical protein [Pseudomonadota bacterium]